MDDQLYMLLRGQRIFTQLLEYSSVPDLEQNIERGFPETRKRQHALNEVTVQTIELTPYIGTKMLHVKAVTTSNGNTHKQALQLLGLTMSNVEKDGMVEFLDTAGRPFYINPIQLTEHNVKVRCNCMDFYYRFANYNQRDKSLAGPPPIPYVRKTTTRPPANPLQVPGMCKHLLKVVRELQTKGLILL